MKDIERGAIGHGGWCVCVACGHREEHVSGVPCRETRCPKCGKVMLREGSPHHTQALARRSGAQEERGSPRLSSQKKPHE
jgi:hypothetical protein